MKSTKIRRALAVGSAALGFLVGYLIGHDQSGLTQGAWAQSKGGAPTVVREGYPQTAPDQPSAEQVWHMDDLRKLHPERVAAGLKGQAPPMLNYMLSRTHSIRLLTRTPKDKPSQSNITKRVSLYDDAEQHQGVSDIYIVVDGGATMVVGGEIEDRQYRPTEGPNPVLLLGEFVGQPIIGGRTYKLKPGDMINIPPDIPHQVQPDAGGITYMLVKVNVGLYPWGQAR